MLIGISCLLEWPKRARREKGRSFKKKDREQEKEGCEGERGGSGIEG